MIRPGPYACLDARFFTDERVAKASPRAVVLLVALVCHCAGELTDGRVPAALLPVIYAQSKAKPRDLAELLELGLVDELGRVQGSGLEGDYYLPAYLSWNPSRAELEAERNAARDRQRAHRERRAIERTLNAL